MKRLKLYLILGFLFTAVHCRAGDHLAFSL